MFTSTPIRIASSVAVLLCAACPAPKPPPEEPKKKPAFEDVRLGWNEPQCLGYAPDSDAYACLDFSMNIDSAGPEELVPMDFTKWQPEPDAVWSGHKSIALVGATLGALKLSEKPHDSSTDIAHSLSQIAALVELEQKGYRPTVTATPLEPGQWLDVAGMSLRFRTQYHAGDDKDPGQYHLGSLQLVCPDDMVSNAIELLPDKRGERAVAFSAPDAKSVVVSVIEMGSPDGGWYFKVNNVRIDPATRCSK